MNKLVRIRKQFLELDMPDPKRHWRRMLVDIGCLVGFGITLFLWLHAI
jgi:hypothetical protein